MDFRFLWSEDKREANLAKHGFDFPDAERVFRGPVFTVEDTRFWYGEKRYLTFGLLDQTPVSIVHTEYAEEIRIISFRKATRREARIYFAEIAH
ncbi:MAG TPA: BrnT family toxin [Rhodanobacteraceae bacterium]|nr:BrnT family toxin [Rhodanobacteraceae bacterium]